MEDLLLKLILSLESNNPHSYFSIYTKTFVQNESKRHFLSPSPRQSAPSGWVETTTPSVDNKLRWCFMTLVALWPGAWRPAALNPPPAR